MNSNLSRTIHSAVLAALLVSTASVAYADGRRWKGAVPVYPVQRVYVHEHSSAAPAVAALIGGFILGSAIANAHPVVVHEAYCAPPLAVYRYYDPYHGVWYESLDECHFHGYHPAVVQVVDVRSGHCVRSLRFEDGGWHRFEGDDD